MKRVHKHIKKHRTKYWLATFGIVIVMFMFNFSFFNFFDDNQGRNIVSFGPGDITTVLTPSRTSCTAPCAIFFDSTNTTSTTTSEPFFELDYSWDFGNPTASYKNFPTAKPNTPKGPLAAHLYENPGNYTVKLTVKDENGDESNKTINITVKDPNNTYSGNTYCLSGNNNFTGCPTQNSNYHITSQSTAFNTLFANDGPRRLLIHNGETFQKCDSAVMDDVTGPFLIDTYGIGTKPMIDSSNCLPSGNNSVAGNVMFRVKDNPSDIAITNLNFYGGYDARDGTGNKGRVFDATDGTGDHIMFLKNNASGFGITFRHGPQKNTFLIGNYITNWQNYGSYGGLEQSAFLGNKIKQITNPLNAPGGRGCAGDYSVAVCPPAHSPIRIPNPKKILISYNDLFNSAGWSSGGFAHGACLRFIVDGYGTYNLVSENIMEGGFTVATLDNQQRSNYTLNTEARLIFERNTLIASRNTQTMIAIRPPGKIIRNNLLIKRNDGHQFPELLSDGSLRHLGESDFGTGIQINSPIFDGYAKEPIRIYGNTLANLDKIRANYTRFLRVEGNSTYDSRPTNGPTNIEVYNNIYYAPYIEEYYRVGRAYQGFIIWTRNDTSSLKSDNNLLYAPNISNFAASEIICGECGSSFGEPHNLTTWQSLGFDTNSLILDPKFVDVNSLIFELAQGSPAINAGRNIILYEDLNGNSRFVGSNPDIGAYEYQGYIPPECSNGIDDDGDGLIDWQNDLGCTGASDTTEDGKHLVLEDGWTVFEPSSDTRIVYVSNSTGNDAWDGMAGEWNGTSGPKSSLSTASALIRDGNPDWLLLKRGDTWKDEKINIYAKNGRSKTEKIIVSTYGNSTIRPKLTTNGTTKIKFIGVSQNHTAIIGIEFEGPGKNNINWESMLETNSGNKNYDVLIEDMYLSESKNGMSLNNIYGLIVRRNVMVNNHHGIFSSKLYHVIAEENIFHNQTDTRGSWAHNWYKSSGGGTGGDSNVTVRKNIFGTAEDADFRIRANSTKHYVYNNLFVGSGQAQGYFDNEHGTRTGTTYYDMNNYGVEIINNTFIGTDHSYALRYRELANSKIENNILANSKSGDRDFLGITPSDSIYLPGTGIYNLDIKNNIIYNSSTLVGLGISCANCTGINVSGNIIQKTSTTLISVGARFPGYYSFRGVGTAPSFNSTYYFSSKQEVTFSNNSYYLDTGSDWFRIGDSFKILNDITNNRTHFKITPLKINNDTLYINFKIDCYNKADYSNESSNSRFIESYDSTNNFITLRDTTPLSFDPTIDTWCRGGRAASLTDWMTFTGEQNPKTNEVFFKDPGRNIETYYASLGNTPSYTDFMGETLKQSKYTWNDSLTAYSVNDYIREGFERINYFGKPIFSELHPKQNSGHKTNSVRFKVRATDIQGINNCTLYLNNVSNQTIPGSSGYDIHRFSVNNMNPGVYIYKISCINNGGNMTESQINKFFVLRMKNFNTTINTNLSDRDLSNINNLILDINSFGRITYTENINLSGGYDLDTHVKIKNNLVEIDTNSIPSLNKRARIMLKGLSFTKPKILKDDKDCTNCSIINYTNGIINFLIDGFSNYSVGEDNSSNGTSAVCGNNLVEGVEICDGTEINNETCTTQGWDSGTLTCLTDCSDYNENSCSNDNSGSGGGGGGGSGSSGIPIPPKTSGSEDNGSSDKEVYEEEISKETADLNEGETGDTETPKSKSAMKILIIILSSILGLVFVMIIYIYLKDHWL